MYDDKAHESHFNLLHQRTAEVSDQCQQFGSRFAHLGDITEALDKRSDLAPSMIKRLDNIAE